MGGNRKSIQILADYTDLPPYPEEAGTCLSQNTV